MVQPNKLLASRTKQITQAQTVTQAANDSDSLSNLTLSQGTWFTTTTTQLDALAIRQNKLETQTTNQLSTIMVQLEMIRSSMEDQQRWQDEYNEYGRYDHDRPFTLDQSNMDEDHDDTNKRPETRAAGDSLMEHASNIK